MHKVDIKICGIRSAVMAQKAVKAGATYIGLICHSDSKRFVNLETACEIAAATQAEGGKPVAVFVQQNAKQMRAFCEATGIDRVQLHGDLARAEHSLLPAHIQKIYVCPVDERGPINSVLSGLLACDSERDYVLFDHVYAGSGRTFAWHALDYRGSFRVGIAGGLVKENVRQAMQRFHPDFLDVSSGVEDEFGEKQIRLITEFLDAAKR